MKLIWNETYTKIKEIFDRKGKHFERYSEGDLELNWIRKVFDSLGHHYGVQETAYKDPLKPDYAFFPDIETLDEAYTHEKGSEDFYKKAVAVGDAKAWNVLLDKSRQGKARREMTNPSYQIDVYLRATPPKWAILTNGKLWRLYHEDTSVKIDCYYEVNLPDLISKIEKTGDITPFKYFYLFFRLGAFPKVPLSSSFLDRIREESTAYAQKIGKDLQENVYKAMKVLAEGFFAESSNKLSLSEEDIRDVQDNSLRLLYRLLFISYAESRKLLDIDNKHYRGISLRTLKEEIASKIDQDETLLAVQSTYWEGLKDLFRLINDGSEAFGYLKDEFYIPAYNGGLFDPSKNSFLAQKRIGNSYLAEAIDLLARSQSEKGKVFVDYSSLDIRHLGSIYEGILEYKLHLAKEPMVAVKEKGKEVWLPKREADGGKKFSDSVEAGRLYLVTDKGERRGTGSFYTPEYIVKYIVKRTLAPLIDPMMEEAIWAEELRKDLFKKLLSIKILDLAMGSGHFLVEATDYIAREIIHAKEIARREDLESEEVAENDIHWARREVVRNCIYGVDLNPMAVELAKLSLWLTTVAANKPLSFLDHHLRCGNSLIGAELGKLMILPNSKRDPSQLPMWQFVLKQQKEHTEDLLKRYAEMAAQPDDDLKTVKEKEKKYEELREEELSRRLTDLADIWLSTYFGNEVDEEEYQELQNFLSPNRFLDWSEFRTKEWFVRAKMLASQKRFFHWEMEFPEAFQGENRGFDVVIGNPPYVRQEGVGDIKNYLGTHFSVYQKTGDLYTYFIERGLQLLKNDGPLSYIVSNKWMRSDYGKPLRRLLKEHSIREIMDFGKRLVFPAVMVHTCILKVSKGSPATCFQAIQVPESLGSMNLYRYVTENSYCVNYEGLRDEGWSLANDRSQNLLDKLQSKGIPLKDYIRGHIYRGLVTGLGEAFVIDEETKNRLIAEDPKSAEVIKPFIGGRDIYRYQPPKNDKYIIAMPKGWTQAKLGNASDSFEWLRRSYPAIAKHLAPFSNKAEKRYDQGDFWWELRACDYYAEFEKPKIMYQVFQGEPTFTLDTSGMLANNAIWMIPTADKILLSILNSKLGWFFISHNCTKIQIGYQLIFKYLGKIPIPTAIASDLQDKFRRDAITSLVDQILDLNEQKQSEVQGFLKWLEGEIGAKVDNLSGASKVRDYYDLEFAGLNAILAKNRNKLKEGYDPQRREPKERLEMEFNDSVANLSMLSAKIEETDHQIDALVFELYSLTEEEIDIVEGKGEI
jgi:type I restriction-modification system DNA methylase subunit